MLCQSASGSEVRVQPVPATLPSMALDAEDARLLQPFRIATPLSARYELWFEPQSGSLRIDLQRLMRKSVCRFPLPGWSPPCAAAIASRSLSSYGQPMS